MWIRLLILIVMLPACAKKPGIPPTSVAEPPIADLDMGADGGDGRDFASTDLSPEAGPAIEPAAARRPTPTQTIPAGCDRSCADDGRCGWDPKEKSCVAVSVSDCLASRRCKEFGYCALEEGRCAEACDRATPEVLRDAAYIGSTGGEGRCVRDPATPCSDTRACAVAGFCVDIDETHCAWGPDCSVPCKKEGACGKAIDRGCFVVADADCEKSEACKQDGRCAAAIYQGCITRAQADAACEPGRISIDGACHFPVGYRCKDECKRENRCEAFVSQLRQDGGKSSRKFVECVESTAYCAGQPACTEKGICGAVKESWYEYNKCHREPCGEPTWGGCAKTAAGCAKSKRCKLDGSCSAESYSQYCRPTIAAHCEQSMDCKRLGNCGLVRISGYHECGATEQAHCEQSDDCKKNGVCAFVRGDCVVPTPIK